MKRLINSLIQESKKGFNEFREVMKDVFTLDKAGEKYELDNLIGMKLREGTALYTEEEI